MDSFDQFLTTVFPDLVTFCGISITQVEALKRISPEDYLSMFKEWELQDNLKLKIVS